MKNQLVLAAVFAGAIGLTPVCAFHEAGVAGCSACHTMHDSQDGMPVLPGPSESGEMLLTYENITELCLSCHATEYGAVWGDNPLIPPPEYGGGNFVFLEEDNINDAPGGGMSPLGGHHAGHNVARPGLGITEDPVNIYAPGGSYPSSELRCTSCHDPHGNNNFRMLRGEGLVPAGNFYFTNPAPDATGIDLQTGPETPDHHTAYRSGMSDWCANCHGWFHDNGPGFEHPYHHGIGGDERMTYRYYYGDSDPIGGDPAFAYLPEVPFESPLMKTGWTAGPTGPSFLSCMVCHRAHATSSPDAGRWDFHVRLLDSDGLESGSYAIPNPYPGPDQHSLCNKCHYQDSQDHGFGQACLECHREETK